MAIKIVLLAVNHLHDGVADSVVMRTDHILR